MFYCYLVRQKRGEQMRFIGSVELVIDENQLNGDFLGGHGINDDREEKWSVFSKYLSNKKTFHNPYPITLLIKKKNIAKTCNLGRGEITCISSNDYFKTIKSEISKNKWLLTTNNKTKY